MLGWSKNLIYYFRNYTEDTTIHGLRYLGERKRSIFERIWWLFFIGLSIYCSVIFILQAYQKWERTPVILTPATSETPIWKIPFPAVTICFQIKADFTNVFRTTDEPISMRFDYLGLICPEGVILNGTDTVDGDVISYLMLVSPNINLGIRDCFWRGGRCDFPLQYGFFKPILTSEGLCHSFNTLDRNDMFASDVALDYYENFTVPHQPHTEWNLEKGYINASNINSFPFRTTLSSIKGGLELTFIERYDFEGYVCDSRFGFKVIIHNPTEIPNFNQHHIRISPAEDVVLAIKPKMVTTSRALKRYSHKKRNCYFSDEKALRFFKIYNEVNCMLECLTNFTYNYCNCVSFYMPRTEFMPICSLRKIPCTREAKKKYMEERVNLQMMPNSNQKNGDSCNCLPSCYSLNYDMDISATKFWSMPEKENSNICPLFSNEENCTRLQIYFKDLQFLASERNELYGQVDFLANCGGLLGLLTGFSLISIAEMVYFITFRIFCNIRRYGRKNWFGVE